MRRRYSRIPIASTGFARSAKRVGSWLPAIPSSAAPPRIAASWPAGTYGIALPVSAMLNGISVAAAIAAPTPRPTSTSRPASQRAMLANWRGVLPTRRMSASSRDRSMAIIVSVLTTAIALNATMIATST